MTKHPHFDLYCREHDVRIGGCRCPGPDKLKQTTDCPGDSCPGAAPPSAASDEPGFTPEDVVGLRELAKIHDDDADNFELTGPTALWLTDLSNRVERALAPTEPEGEPVEWRALREAFEAIREVEHCTNHDPASVYCDACFSNMFAAFRNALYTRPSVEPEGASHEGT